MRPPPHPPDVEAQWAGIERRLRRRAETRARRRVGALGCLAALLVVVAVLAWPGPGASTRPARAMGPAMAELRLDPRPVREGALAVSDAVEPSTFRLAGGSTVTTAPGTRVSVCRSRGSACVEIRRGEAHVEAHERLVVRVGRVHLEAQGDPLRVDRFVVRYREAAAAFEDITVAVIEGSVRARVRDGRKSAAHELQAGATWRAPEARPLQDDPARADTIFAEARSLARGGEHQAAARAYQAFLEAFPEDPRQATAALELGRLRMDVLRDPTGALAPLRRAARARGPVQADAQARYVRALHAARQWSECRRQRERYRERFPDGVHRQSLAPLCAPSR